MIDLIAKYTTKYITKFLGAGHGKEGGGRETGHANG